jgi:hypothetical protein
LELINEQESEVLRKLVTDYTHRLPCLSFEHFVDTVLHLMHHQHKVIKVKFLLAIAYVQGLVKQIDHEGFTAAGLSMDVNMLKVV